MKEIGQIGYGLNIVNRYTRNWKLHMQDTLLGLASTAKHMRISPMLSFRHNAHKLAEHAYQKGIRIFDTARIYGYSEAELGKMIAGHNREDFFICTKVSDMDLTRLGGAPTVRGNLENSLKDLKTDYVDLYMLHWPSGNWMDMYEQMDKLYREGLIKHIGVSNFTVENFLELEKYPQLTAPQYCQIECHPYCQNSAVISYCNEHGINVLAHTPTGRMKPYLIHNECLQSIAKAHNKSIAQVILRWHIQSNRIPITHTKNISHLDDNVDIFDFALTQNEMKQIDDLNEEKSFFSIVGIDNPNYRYNK